MPVSRPGLPESVQQFPGGGVLILQVVHHALKGLHGGMQPVGVGIVDWSLTSAIKSCAPMSYCGAMT